MCEPAHSIVQYDPSNDDDNAPFGGQVDTGSVLSKLGNWAKKIGRWFHISKMGAGHSGATMHGRQQLLYLPPSNDFEGFWWEKGSFKHDTWGVGFMENDPQFQAAYEYHLRSCMGSMQIFRRFFEASMLASVRPRLYVVKFLEYVMTPKGRDELVAKLNRLSTSSGNEKLVKVVMGYTRKRNLLIPEWAQDDVFWKGGVS